MPAPVSVHIDRLAAGIRAALSRIEVLALFPLLALAGLAMGDHGVLFATSFALPGLLAIQALRRPPAGDAGPAPGGIADRNALLSALDRAGRQARQRGRRSACILVELDDLAGLRAQWGDAALDTLLALSARRLAGALRAEDVAARLCDGRFGIALAPIRRDRVDIFEGIAARIRAAMEDPVEIDGRLAHPDVSIGYCTDGQAGGGSANALLEGARAALDEALRAGPGALRGYSGAIRARSCRRSGLAAQVETALTSGQIRPWFQPQVSADTGALSGFEALARWQHPDHGLLTPADFLPAVCDAGRMGQLGDTILFHALSALCGWDRAGFRVPAVAINLSTEELRDPTLADRIEWEVDRFDLRPARLTVEILETVAAQAADDTIMRNIAQLGSHGFNLDLDDFGTGQASIANIRRFGVDRIKIDRCFVTHVDTDPAQRAIVAGILALAERMGLDTVAEGVETPGEHSLLAQLGCGHVQGFGLARPMPVEQTPAWIRAHAARIAETPQIGRRAV